MPCEEFFAYEKKLRKANPSHADEGNPFERILFPLLAGIKDPNYATALAALGGG